MYSRKKNVLPAQWLPDFSPEHLTSRPSIRKNPSLPPLYVKKDEKDVQLERLGLGYLLKGSHSDPNIPEAQLAVDPLRNLRYIKEHIKQSNLFHYIALNVLRSTFEIDCSCQYNCVKDFGISKGVFSWEKVIYFFLI